MSWLSSFHISFYLILPYEADIPSCRSLTGKWHRKYYDGAMSILKVSQPPVPSSTSKVAFNSSVILFQVLCFGLETVSLTRVVHFSEVRNVLPASGGRCILKMIFNEKFVVPSTRILPVRRTTWETKYHQKVIGWVGNKNKRSHFYRDSSIIVIGTLCGKNNSTTTTLCPALEWSRCWAWLPWRPLAKISSPPWMVSVFAFVTILLCL